MNNFSVKEGFIIIITGIIGAAVANLLFSMGQDLGLVGVLGTFAIGFFAGTALSAGAIYYKKTKDN